MFTSMINKENYTSFITGKSYILIVKNIFMTNYVFITLYPIKVF